MQRQLIGTCRTTAGKIPSMAFCFMPWNMKPLSLIYINPCKKNRAGVSMYWGRITLCRVPANAPRVKLTVCTCCLCHDSDALNPL